MGAFNEVYAELTCPRCGKSSFMVIQFKFGDTWQHEYRVGEKLKWGGNDVGSPDQRCVLVAGLAGPCPFCDADGLECDVVVEFDVIAAVTASSGTTVREAKEGFVVVE